MKLVNNCVSFSKHCHSYQHLVGFLKPYILAIVADQTMKSTTEVMCMFLQDKGNLVYKHSLYVQEFQSYKNVVQQLQFHL